MRTSRYLAYILIIAVFILITVKFAFWNYTFDTILPKTKYEVSFNLSAEGFKEPVNISTYLPQNNIRQNISKEINSAPDYNLQMKQTSSGKIAVWHADNLDGRGSIFYSFEFLGEALQYNIDTTLTIPSTYPPDVKEYLKSTSQIQVNHPYIKQIYQQQCGNENTIVGILKSIHKYVQSLKSKPFKGVTDALTTAKLGEASCNGKSRLFAALARNADIPCRLVGGIILENGSKKTSHQWVEAYIEGEWVPFDPLNNHFAFLPHNYLQLYTGDEFLFTHTPNINFNYQFNIKSRLSPNPLLSTELKKHPFNAYKLWEIFEKIGIPLGLLKIILLLPLGALLVAIFRNVVGLKTFGIFLPALIAIGSRETGLLWGVVAYVMVVGIVSVVHFPLERWGILYTPKLVIMLVCVVMVFIFSSFLAISFNLISLAYVTLFPIVVLTLSAERFARIIMESGYREAIYITLQTIIVIIVVYMAINSTSMEAMFLAFPELFLAIIGFSLILGKWIGLRVFEYIRFRFIIK